MIDVIYERLFSRLPELEWKLSQLGNAIHKAPLPRGLFQTVTERSATAFIEELKRDLALLKLQTNERRAHHVAEQIFNKITTLVNMCQKFKDPSSKELLNPLSIQAMNTRQDYLSTLKRDIQRLKAQQEALQETLQRSQSKSDVELALMLQKELGEVRRQLTLAEEGILGK